jgi:hypothetical protein
MWESKDNALDANYNADHIWFDGIGGQHTQKPVDIRKWEDSKVYKLIEKHFPKVKADKMLADLSSIALEWAESYVRQRQTFKVNTKGENMAPLAFQSDPDGLYHDLAVQLRNIAINGLVEDEEGMAIVESADTEESPRRTAPPKTARSGETPFAPPATPARLEEIKFKRQREIITSWVDDPRHAADASCRHALELYAQLNDSEFLYLQTTYDEARCFFLQWVLGKEIKELVNSARISSVQAGKKFTWIHARAEVLRSLTDITYTVRFLALARLKRQAGTAAKLLKSQVLTRKALLEDPKLPAPITLPEALYLEILVGQMSAQETTVFDCPSIGNDLSAKDGRGRAKHTLERIKRSIDDCSNPPHFRGVKTPVTDIMDQTEPKIPKEKRDQTKPTGHKTTSDKDRKPRDQTKNPTKTHLDRRPDHEQPSKLPPSLKRPNLDAVVDGNKIASRRNVSYMMTSSAVSVRAATRAATFAETARNHMRSGKKNSTKKRKNIGSLWQNGNPEPPLPPLPLFTLSPL